jgi:hypothetical protein
MRATFKIEKLRLLVNVRPSASTVKYPDNLTPKGGEKIPELEKNMFSEKLT